MFKGLTKRPLHDLFRQAHKLGAVGTHIADTAIFATRHTPKRGAWKAGPRAVARGAIGKHSVWEGPTRVAGGAPILRREKIA